MEYIWYFFIVKRSIFSMTFLITIQKNNQTLFLIFFCGLQKNDLSIKFLWAFNELQQHNWLAGCVFFEKRVLIWPSYFLFFVSLIFDRVNFDTVSKFDTSLIRVFELERYFDYIFVCRSIPILGIFSWVTSANIIQHNFRCLQRIFSCFRFIQNENIKNKK